MGNLKCKSPQNAHNILKYIKYTKGIASIVTFHRQNCLDRVDSSYFYIKIYFYEVIPLRRYEFAETSAVNSVCFRFLEYRTWFESALQVWKVWDSVFAIKEFWKIERDCWILRLEIGCNSCNWNFENGFSSDKVAIQLLDSIESQLWIWKRKIFLKVDIDYQNKRCESGIHAIKLILTSNYRILHNVSLT